MDVLKYKETLLGMDLNNIDLEMQAVQWSYYAQADEVKLRCKLIMEIKHSKFWQK